MNLLLHPTFLWALSGLIVPVTIHLLNRKEGKVIQFGSLRHLFPSPPRQFKSIRLNEFVLLALRSLIIILLVMIMAGVQWTSFLTHPKKWLLVERGLERDKIFLVMMDSLWREDYEVRYLATEFPLLSDSNHVSSIGNYWDLVEQLRSEELSRAVVFSRNIAGEFRGHRPSLPPNIRWVIQEPGSIDYPLKATRRGADSLVVRIGNSQNRQTDFENEKIKTPGDGPYFRLSNSETDSVLISYPDTVRIQVVSDPSFGSDRRIILAALKAIQQSVSERLIISEADFSSWNPGAADWIFWFSNQSMPPNPIRNSVGFQARESSPLLIKRTGRHWLFTRRLDEETALQENLTLQLLKVLFPDKKEEQLASRKDRRVLSGAMAWSEPGKPEVKSSGSLPRSDSANRYLLILFVVTLLTERIIAYKRSQ